MPSGFCTGASSHRFTYRTTHGKSVFASTALMTRSLRTLSKNLLDVKVDHPVGSPAAPPADLHRVLRGSPGTAGPRLDRVWGVRGGSWKAEERQRARRITADVAQPG